MTEKLRVDQLYKVFGAHPERALELRRQGLDKDAIFARTGMTIGVDNASFSIDEGEVFVVMGLSGSGKSTLVRMLNRLIEPTSGQIFLDGREVTAMSASELRGMRRRDMSMVFQSFALLPHRTVLDNAAFGLEAAGEGRRQRRQAAMRALEAVGLASHANSYPDELSGGMQQRVGLARALAVNPSILLMDEAFSALDPLIRTEMQDELLRLQQEETRTVVFISHDLDEAIRIGDRIAIMESGRIAQVGTPEEIVNNPADDYVRSFFYGVDVSQVFSAGDVATRKQVTLIQRPGVDVAAALEHLREHEGTSAVVVGRDRRYLGLVTEQALQEQMESPAGERLGRAMVADLEPLPADMPLSDVVARVAESPWPMPVVDGDGRYVGSITKTALLHVLKKTG